MIIRNKVYRRCVRLQFHTTYVNCAFLGADAPWLLVVRWWLYVKLSGLAAAVDPIRRDASMWPMLDDVADNFGQG